MKILLIIFLVLMVSHKVLTKRLVENTTCLGLVKPSNQQLRLTCSNPSDYHCLLDETFTREFEVCREWKWIPGGKCAYFNTYGNGNVDERECKPGINLTCSESNQQFESYKNTQFTACYKKKPIVTSIFTTTSTSIQVTSNWTTNGDVETPSTSNIWTVLPTVFGIIVPFLSVSLTCVICMRFKSTKKDNTLEGQKGDEEKLSMHTESDENEFYDVNEVLSTDGKSSVKEKIDDNSEKRPLLEKHADDSLKNSLTIRRGNKDNTPEEQREDEEKAPKNTTDSDNIKSDVEKEKTKDSTDEFNEVHKNCPKEYIPEGQKWDKEKASKNTEGSDNIKTDVEEEKTKDSTDELNEVDKNCPKGKSDNERENEEELTDVFGDTFKSLKVPIEVEKVREECTNLYRLLENEGNMLAQKVMTAIFIKNAGNSLETLGNNKTYEEEGDLKEKLPEDSTSFKKSYDLHKKFLDKKHHPKSGWGNPIRETDIGIGDDIERLHRIQNIVCETADPVTLSLESYIRLLNIMIEALTRLDPDGEFKEDFKQLSYKLESIKNPNLTQRMLKRLGNFLKIW